MVPTLLKGLAEEKIVLINSTQAAKLPFRFEGIVRLVDKEGNTLGFVIDKDILDELEEELEAANPGFLASLEESRQSGRISGKEVKRKAGLL